ncbi:MAG: hypothetical protein HY475_03205 [Candidatus Terrybacteria bacterium]|nr:hypothetical protein [Candidatus Terrybacteria bacterium]
MIELRDLIRIFRRIFPVLLAATVTGAAIGSFVAGYVAAAPSATAVVSLRTQGITPGGNDALYDGYYLVETERRFGDLLADILRTTSLHAAMEGETGVTLGRTVRVTPWDYRVNLRGPNALSPETTVVLQRLLGVAVREMSVRSGEPLEMSAAVGDAVPSPSVPREVGGLIGGSVALLLTALAVLLRRYLTD